MPDGAQLVLELFIFVLHCLIYFVWLDKCIYSLSLVFRILSF